MFENYAFSIFVFAAIIFVGGFAVGTQWNVRKGDRVLKWFRDGLPLIGERSTMRWLGSSVVELKIQKAKDPFRNAETLVVLEPRDVLLLWAFFHARGRRDLLIFRAQLRTAPTFELEVFVPRAWTTQQTERDVKRKNWTRLENFSSSFEAYYSGNGAEKIANPIIDLAKRAGGQLVRLSVHRTVPNLEIHWTLPDLQTSSSRDLFTNLRRVAEEALRA